MNEMNYKGYIGTAEISEADDCLHGKLAHISDLVTYQAATPKQLTAAFEEAVDDYLETCAELEKEPDKPFKGSFNVRTTPETHRKAANLADMTGVKLNKFCGDALYVYSLALEKTLLEVSEQYTNVLLSFKRDDGNVILANVAVPGKTPKRKAAAKKAAAKRKAAPKKKAAAKRAAPARLAG